MLTEQQIAHFRLFGFVILRGWLNPEETVTLATEVQHSLKEGYGTSFGQRVCDDFLEGHYMPVMASSSPFSLSLVADDPGFYQAAQQLLEAPVLPCYAEGVLYFDQTPWHFDDGIGVEGVKFVTYFQPLTAQNGALRLLPGSQYSEMRKTLEDYRSRFSDLASVEGFRQHIEAFPGIAAETQPGDFIAFDVHTWHASYGGKDRYSWSIEYLKDPSTALEREKYCEWMLDSCDQSERRYDHERFPLYRDWVRNEADNSTRAAMIKRMKELGVFAMPGADQ